MYVLRRCTTAAEFWASAPSCNLFWTAEGWGSFTHAVEFKKPWHAEDYAAEKGVTGYAVCGPM